jgi:hypothetical protein
VVTPSFSATGNTINASLHRVRPTLFWPCYWPNLQRLQPAVSPTSNRQTPEIQAVTVLDALQNKILRYGRLQANLLYDGGAKTEMRPSTDSEANTLAHNTFDSTIATIEVSKRTARSSRQLINHAQDSIS